MSDTGRVQRFRSAEAMNAATPRRADADFDRFLRHCARYWRLARPVYPRGVFRFRSIDEAQQERQRRFR
jgi:hypothetical protein